MKKLIKSLCSVFCFVNMALPVIAQPLIGEDILESIDGQSEPKAEKQERKDGYHLALMTGDFSLQLVGLNAHSKNPVGTLMLFVSNPEGRIVKDAQVITTIIDSFGNQQMNRACPCKGGYVIGIEHLLAGYCRVETEIAAGGRLLTDEFTFFKS